MRILEESCYLVGSEDILLRESDKEDGDSLKRQQLIWLISGWVLAGILGIMLWAGYRQEPTEPPRPSERANFVNLVDPNYPAADDEPGWDYRQEVEADLDGDGSLEHILVTARAERSPSNPNEYLWDDGQPWQVVVTSLEGEKTLVYSRWVQIGQLRVLVGEPQQNERSHLIILELTGANVSMYRVEYNGPGQTNAESLIEVPIINQAGPALLP